MPRSPSLDSSSSKTLRVHGVHLLHSVDMPTSMVEDLGTVLTGPNGSSKRSSMERSLGRPSRSSVDELVPGSSPYAQNNGNVNGTTMRSNGGTGLHNGSLKIMATHLPVGAPLHRKAGQEKELAVRSGAPTDSRPSTIIDLEQMREEKEFQPQEERDDGHFADAPQSEREDTFLGFSTTYVTLNAVNGELPNFPPTMTDGNASSDFVAEAEQSTPTVHPDSTNEDSKTAQQQQQHLIPSPPAFPNPSTNSLSATAPNRSTQRHTLEVPRVSTSRLSREMTRPGEDAYASGRFSPVPNTPTRRRNSVSLVRRVTRSAHSDLHLDEVAQSEDPDADRWADMIKQRRASKRRRKEDDDEDRVVMGTKVDQNHVNYVTAYNMLTGIRFTVSRTNAKLDRELVEADFDAKHKFSFDM
jgi:1-phosphatidylinositol-4-phosphate 5-kinase